ncbi:Uncharacterised protein [Vibrio cholerae]|nr:Uncharacterised protein [Vibrio cholerae]CSI40750.1 Uncharacterised protein [Vibrio cholerae]
MVNSAPAKASTSKITNTNSDIESHLVHFNARLIIIQALK